MNTKEKLTSLLKIKKSSESCAEETSKCINEAKQSFLVKKDAVCREIECLIYENLQAFLKSEGYSFSDVDIELSSEKKTNKICNEVGATISAQTSFEVSLKVNVEL